MATFFMNHSSIVLIIFLVGLSLLVTTLMSYAYAEHDYISPFLQWETRPSVCLRDIPPEDLWLTLRAVHEWEKSLREYTQSNYWDYDVFKINSTEKDIYCDINIEHGRLDRMAFGNMPVIGEAACGESLGAMCMITIDRQGSIPLYYETLVHELGHTMGLGHRLAVNGTAEGFAAIMMSNDVMFPQVKVFMKISQADLDALIYFKSIEPYWGNYTVPHDNDW